MKKALPAASGRQAGGEAVFTVSESDLPLAALGPRTALAVISNTEGPAYRPRGAGMAVAANGAATGHLSSGCIDKDVALHMRAALRDGRLRRLRYGLGSPFRDLELPCGGGLDILIQPRLDLPAIAHARAELAARRAAWLKVAPGLTLRILPQLRFLVFGIGPEARTFAEIVHAAGYRAELFSPDDDTIGGVRDFHASQILGEWPQDLATDDWSAVALFFHDHDREIALLRHALAAPGFYIGAMGSQRAAAARREALLADGMPPEQLQRLRHPFGLIPSARNPRSLAISVLADALGFSDQS